MPNPRASGAPARPHYQYFRRPRPTGARSSFQKNPRPIATSRRRRRRVLWRRSGPGYVIHAEDHRLNNQQNHKRHKPTNRVVRRTTSALHYLTHRWRSASLVRRVTRGGTYTPDKGRRSIFLDMRHEKNGRKLWSKQHGRKHLTGPNRRHINRPGVGLV